MYIAQGHKNLHSEQLALIKLRTPLFFFLIRTG